MSRGQASAASAAPSGVRFFRALLALLLAACLAGAGVTLWLRWGELSPMLNPTLTRVRIQGELQHLAGDDIRAKLASFAGTGFFALDLRQVRERVESLQWVESAAVGRRWPDTLTVDITEATVIARWGADRLITQRGEMIEADAGAIDTLNGAALPLLGGPPGSQFEVMRQYQRLNQILYPAGLRLSGLSTSPRRSWRLQLNGVTEVVLGGEDLVNRLQRYVDFHQRQPESERLRHEIVDLRYGSRFSIRLREFDAGAGELARR